MFYNLMQIVYSGEMLAPDYSVLVKEYVFSLLRVDLFILMTLFFKAVGKCLFFFLLMVQISDFTW